jgi:hypothetical protein
MVGLEEGAQQVISVLPPDVASSVVFLVQAIGGLLVIYLIFLVIKLFMLRKHGKMLKEMHSDIKLIKRKLKIH